MKRQVRHWMRVQNEHDADEPSCPREIGDLNAF